MEAVWCECMEGGVCGVLMLRLAVSVLVLCWCVVCVRLYWCVEGRSKVWEVPHEIHTLSIVLISFIKKEQKEENGKRIAHKHG